jgi:asparagine synthase (glutamine-hydrolysing)
MFADILSSPRAKQRGFFEPAFVQRLVDEHVSGRRDHTLRLWQFLVLELWHRHYVDSPAAPVARAAGRTS